MERKIFGDLEFGNDPVIPKEPEVTQAEDALEKVEKILSDVSTGWKVQIQRIEPSWCKGILETIDVDDGNPVDIDYLVRTWGGEKLRLRVKDPNGIYRGGADVPLYSYEPLHFGRPKKHPAAIDETSSTPPNPLADIDSLLGIIERLKGSQQNQSTGLDLHGLAELLAFVRPAPNPQPMFSGIEQILQLSEAYKALRTTFGGEDDKQMNPDDLFGKVQGILESYSKLQEINKNSPKRPSIGPPRHSQQNPAILPGKAMNVQKQAPNVHPTLPNVQDSLNAESLSDLISSLAQQNPDLATDSLILALDKMPDDTREAVLGQVYDILDGEDETFDGETEKEQNLIHNATGENRPPESTGR